MEWKRTIKLLKMLSQKVKLSRFKKHPRGPKKPKPKRVFAPKHPHVSTAKLIANRKNKSTNLKGLAK